MADPKLKPSLLESLDALRGFDMLWIIGGGDVIHALARACDSDSLNLLSDQMEHVPWEGFHFEDLIMPLFLFMAGVAIPFSAEKRLRSGESKRTIILHAFKRWILLFLLGMIYEGNLLAFDPGNVYLIGSVLGAIGIGYFFSVLIYTRLELKNQIWLTAGLIAAYWFILTFIPEPGKPAGLLLPESNITRFVEHSVFRSFARDGVAYMWFLDTAGFISTVMTGVFAGTIIRGNAKLPFIRSSSDQVNRTIILVFSGSLLVLSALIMSIWFPVIKNIWSPAFILLTSGISFILLALFYFLIDVKGFRRWAFWLKVIGMNSITVYLGVHFIPFGIIAGKLVFGLEGYTGLFYPVIQSLTSLTIIYIILYWMYRKGTFLRI